MSPAPVVERARTAAALLLLWAVAFASAPGRIVADTKIDLPLDPAGFAGRALHLWDGSTTFGVLQNQAYGYLFPMAPFAMVGHWLMEPWVTQRVWWGALLTVGYLSARALLTTLRVGTPLVRHVGALAFALSPRVVSTLGPISSESAPALLAPAILLPVVLAATGRLPARRAAALSGLALLLCGGVNATATACAVLPTALYLATRTRWWRAALTWWWSLAVVAATAWWVLPLVLLGRYSPPFLDWIESSDTVTRTISLLDDVRGTSHWLGHLVTQAGPWWDAGYAITAQPALIVATSVAAAAGLAGLARRDVPERRFLLVTATVGVIMLSLPHSGVLSSPFSDGVQHLLDGPLAALRNLHKADPVLRLPLVVGFTHLLGVVARSRRAAPRGAAARLLGRPAWEGVPGLVAVALLVAAGLATAVPGLNGQLPSRGSFDALPQGWAQAGRWLSQHAGDGVALQVPSSNFAEFLWGRPLDDVLHTQTSARVALRDAVPLTPANTIRMLDALEHGLQEGDALGEGQLAVLRSAGVRYLVLRNDLDTGSTGAPPTAIARQALRRTGDLRLAQGFGPTLIDAYGDRVRPVEVFELRDPAPEPRAAMVDLRRVARATGAGESVADAIVGADAVVLDGDGGPAQGPRVVTDGYRARDRAFGGVRGRDVTPTLTPSAADDASDYLPWPGVPRTTVAYDGLADLTATTSLADDAGGSGLDLSTRPFAAVDGLSSSSWVGYADRDPELRLTFSEPRDVTGLEVSLLADRTRYGELLGIPTRLSVSTDSGSVDVRVATTGRAQRLTGVPSGPTRHLRIGIAATDRGSSALVTGLSEVRVPGLVVRESLTVPDAGSVAVDRYELGQELRGFDGCIEVRAQWVCDADVRMAEELTGLDRRLPVPVPGTYRLTGTLRASPGTGLDSLLDAGQPSVVASSRLSPAPQVRPGAVVDGDPATAWSPAPTDPQPTLAVHYPAPITVTGVRLDVRGEWLTGREPTAQVRVDGQAQLSLVGQDGTIRIRPARGRTVSVRLILGASDKESEPAAGLAVRELVVDGAPATRPSPTRVHAGCGQGPEVAIGGRSVPTEVTGDRRAAYAAGQLAFRACTPVAMAGPRTRLIVQPWGGFVPDRATLAREGAPVSSTGPARPLRVDGATPASLDVSVGSGAASLLVLGQNANPGWSADLASTPLRPVTVDGWQQAFVVPAGASGQVHVTFAPDRTYRLALLGGALLVVLLLGALVAPAGRPRPRLVPGPAVRGAGPVAAVVVSVLLLGWWGLLIAAAALGLARASQRRSALVPELVAGGSVALAGVLQAVLAPGALGPAVVEGLLRVLCVLAVVTVLAAPRTVRAPSPSGDAPASAR